MEPGICDVEAGPVLRQDTLERCKVRPGTRIGYADDLRTVRPQERLKVGVAGVVDDDRVTWLEKKAAEQIDGLRARFGEHNAFRRYVDAPLPEKPRYELPQRGQSQQRAVICQRARFGSSERP